VDRRVITGVAEAAIGGSFAEIPCMVVGSGGHVADATPCLTRATFHSSSTERRAAPKIKALPEVFHFGGAFLFLHFYYCLPISTVGY